MKEGKDEYGELFWEIERHIGESDKYVWFNKKLEIILAPVAQDKEEWRKQDKEKEEVARELRDERKIWKKDVKNLLKRAEKKKVDLSSEMKNMVEVLHEYDNVKATYKRIHTSITYNELCKLIKRLRLIFFRESWMDVKSVIDHRKIVENRIKKAAKLVDILKKP